MDLQTWWVWKSLYKFHLRSCFFWGVSIRFFWGGCCFRCYTFFWIQKKKHQTVGTESPVQKVLASRPHPVGFSASDLQSKEHQDMFFHWHPPLKDQHLEVSKVHLYVYIYIYLYFRGSSSWQWVFCGGFNLWQMGFLLGEFVAKCFFFLGGRGFMGQ